MKITDTFLQAFNERRFGQISLTRKVVTETPDVAQAILSTCLVLRCELLGHMDVFEYVICHPQLKALPPGVMAPIYNVTVSAQVDDNGNTTEVEHAFT